MLRVRSGLNLGTSGEFKNEPQPPTADPASCECGWQSVFRSPARGRSGLVEGPVFHAVAVPGVDVRFKKRRPS